jgi:hypothetical protein
MADKLNNYKSFWGYVFSDRRTVKILNRIVLFYIFCEMAVIPILQKTDEIFGFAVPSGGEIRRIIIDLIYIPLLWIFLNSIHCYLECSRNKSFWRYFFNPLLLSGLAVSAPMFVPVDVLAILFPNVFNAGSKYYLLLFLIVQSFFYSVHRYFLSKYGGNKSLSGENNGTEGTELRTVIPQKVFHFTRTFSETEQKKLFDGLVNKGYLAKETDFKEFCRVFRTETHIDTGSLFYGLTWTKTNTKSGEKNIRALLDLLALLGIPEKEILDKALLNRVFNTGTTIHAHHYTNITDNNHFLKPFKSEHHDELDKIVKQSNEE